MLIASSGRIFATSGAYSIVSLCSHSATQGVADSSFVVAITCTQKFVSLRCKRDRSTWLEEGGIHPSAEMNEGQAKAAKFIDATGILLLTGFLFCSIRTTQNRIRHIVHPIWPKSVT